MANSQFGIGTHAGCITRRSHGTLKAHTLVCFDDNPNYVKTCSEADTPWGIVTHDALSPESLVCIQPLSSCGETAKLKLSGVVKAGQFLCKHNGGTVRSLPTAEGFYQVIGIALVDGLNDDYVEAITTLPYTMEVE